MAPKVTEKQLTSQQQHQQQFHNNSTAIKHSSPFHISAYTLCHNKRLKLKRSKYGEYLRKVCRNNQSSQQIHKTEVRRQKLSLLQADVTINLLSDDEESSETKNSSKQSMVVYPERMSLERAAILGLMPVERRVAPPPLAPLTTNHHQIQQTPKYIQKVKQQQQPLLMVSPPQTQLCKRKSKPQKRPSLPAATRQPILLNHESIVLSDDSNDEPVIVMSPPVQLPDLSVTCLTSSQIPCPPQLNSMQVDEEVTISLVPRSLNNASCTGRKSLNNSDTMQSNQKVFPMLPDETTVHTVIANRIYELSLTKLREGLASCGIPEFADGQQKISPQRRKGIVQQLPMVSPPQAPISLKLSSDLSISLISDDEDDTHQRQHKHEPILSPAFLQKLPVNVSIAPVAVPVRPQTNHTTGPRKLKLH